MERRLSRFEIGFEWIERDYGSAVDRATFAQIEMYVDGICATRVEDTFAKTVRPFVRASAHTLALWIAANWWRLRWEPHGTSTDWSLSHNLASAGEGYLWPHLILSSDGLAVSVSNHAGAPDESGPIRYLNEFKASVPADAFELGAAQFIEAVIERVENVSVGPTDLTDVWRDVQAERNDPAATAWRRLEAKLGLDPDGSPEFPIEALLEQGADIGTDAVEEVAATAKADTPSVLTDLLNARSCAISMVVPESSTLSSCLAPVSGTPAWQPARDAAIAARKEWGVSDGPLKTSDLADLFQLNPSALTEAPRNLGPMPAGYLTNEGKSSVLLTRSHPSGQRFALARLVADQLFSHSDSLFPVTDSLTYRQKFQRAFAQEFLCPYEDLASHLGTSDPTESDIEYAASYFDVSTRLIEHTLENNQGVQRTW